MRAMCMDSSAACRKAIIKSYPRQLRNSSSHASPNRAFCAFKPPNKTVLLGPSEAMPAHPLGSGDSPSTRSDLQLKASMSSACKSATKLPAPAWPWSEATRSPPKMTASAGAASVCTTAAEKTDRGAGTSPFCSSLWSSSHRSRPMSKMAMSPLCSPLKPKRSINLLPSLLATRLAPPRGTGAMSELPPGCKQCHALSCTL
mmetsp:Transcript_115995/g.323057  ORF Transcript_115995/g.323057 Transcript_115995/m.323057 type:complete len:201 (-) Transcript_115995:572-1174(-)